MALYQINQTVRYNGSHVQTLNTFHITEPAELDYGLGDFQMGQFDARLDCMQVGERLTLQTAVPRVAWIVRRVR